MSKCRLSMVSITEIEPNVNCLPQPSLLALVNKSQTVRSGPASRTILYSFVHHFLWICLSRTCSSSLMHLHLGHHCRRSRVAVSRPLIIWAVCLPPARVGPLHFGKCDTTCSTRMGSKWPPSRIHPGEVGLRLPDPFSLGHVLSA